MKKEIKKKLLVLAVSAGFLTYVASDYHYSPRYEIYDEYSLAFGCYSKGKIYIGDSLFLSSLTDIEENDILVLDQRNRMDPNMKILNSYNITSKEERNEILEVLCRFEECYPSRWSRSIESMRLEWFTHNFSHNFNYMLDHADDVDLNNSDEDYYDKMIIRKILKL